VSLKPFIENDPIVREADESLASLFGGELLPETSNSHLEIRVAYAKSVGIKTLQELTEAIQRYRKPVEKFAERCNKEVWRSSPRAGVGRGIFVSHLCNYLQSLEGKNSVLKFLSERNVNTISWNVDKQVEIAKEISAQFKTE